jgi:hypothetical protein
MDLMKITSCAAQLHGKHNCGMDAAIIAAAMGELTLAVNGLLEKMTGIPAQQVTQPQAPPEPAPAPAVPVAAAPATATISLDEMRQLFAAKAQAGLKAQLLTVLGQFGAKKLPDIDPAKFPEVKAVVEGLAA